MSFGFTFIYLQNSVNYFGGRMMEIAHIFANLMVLMAINLVIKLLL